MNITTLRGVLLCCSLVTLLFTVGCQRQQEQITLRMAHTLDQEHVVHKAMVYMAERLEHYSAGQMHIQIYSGGQLGSERELIELLQIGSLALTKVSASPLEGFVPKMQVFSVPYVFRDSAHLWAVLNGAIGQDLLNSMQKARLHGLGYYDAGSRSFYTTNKAVHQPADLKGLKFRVPNSQTAVQMVQTLGGAATPVDWGELYTALQQGVVDGAENNPPSFYLSRHYELSKYYSLDEHTSVPDVILMSLPVWESLNTQQQGWVQQAMNDSVRYQRELWQEASDDALAKVKAAGVEVIYPDKAAFAAAVKPLHQSLQGTEVGDLMAEIALIQAETAGASND
ncbi:TRAP transporter substrate-binding protein [Rheinheimera soli]|uniref:Tripartite ATP-independent transporter DctP family solute receptor n=1 Tax=Rheinheimera soli TaxID=443616 RepID=A0ABU1VXU4_9GAMM|nr:TRAP transporter substrate-binding protein [Rheinheimera soli]MDR7120545.1 tripartite ATP-independent transporter DctP family solute receptor [Rheinheimera soli]